MPSANSAIEATEASAPGIVTGGSADVSEAATETVGQGGSRDETGPQDAGPDDSGPDDEGSDDSGPVKTIAESAGLEDETVSSDQTAETASQAEAEAPQVPAGMETVDLSEGETAETNSPDAADTPVEEPAPKRTSRSRSRKKPAEKPAETQDDVSPADDVETVSGDDDVAEVRAPRVQRPKARKYKIQEVVKVRQIMLVQVVKEERGNKGAALTTYLSLAGRYCVLMPNTARGGGISRKITQANDRKKLKEIASEITVPEGAGLIIRTAGAKRSKPEIRRDYEYLMRLWEQVRELTMRSVAPAAIYEEGNLIKRSIRDLYSREIDEVLVEGAEGYRVAKDFMRMIMPSHAKAVQPYNDPTPLFARFQVESYLAGMFNPTVQLKSGGYIVIGITEALVAIDVNSGRATKEGSIEDTATKTNLEAAEEVARQLRLRDLAGLIVIDFIDMEDRRNNAAVEKRLKDKLKTDRARIQVGRISGFGLMEMSRQRLRPGMLESTTQPCAHCHGTGLIRSDDSMALQILRALEEEGTRKRSKEVLLRAPVAVVNFLLNQKREHIALIEARYGMSVRVEADPSLISPDFTLEKFKTATRSVPEISAAISGNSAFMGAVVDDIEDPDIPDEEDEDEATEAAAAAVADSPRTADAGDGDGTGRKKRRRRRRRRGGNTGVGDENGSDEDGDESDGDDDSVEDGVSDAAAAEAGTISAAAKPEVVAAAQEEEAKPAAKPRRTRSRKPKATPEDVAGQPTEKPAGTAEATPETPTEASADATVATGTGDAGVKPKAKPRTRRPRVSKAAAAAAEEALAEAQAVVETPVADPDAPAETPAPAAVVETPADAAPASVQVTSPEPAVANPVAQAPVAETSSLLPDPGDAPEINDGLRVDPGLAEAEAAENAGESEAKDSNEDKPRRRGWWNLGR